MHPLASISEQVNGVAHCFKSTNTLAVDNQGNFQVEYDLIPVTLMMKSLTERPQYVNSKGDIVVLNVRCYVLSGLTVVDLTRLFKIELDDKRVIVEVNPIQKLLKPLNKIFGLQFIGLLLPQ